MIHLYTPDPNGSSEPTSHQGITFQVWLDRVIGLLMKFVPICCYHKPQITCLHDFSTLSIGKPPEFNVSWLRRGHPVLKYGDLSIEASHSLGLLLDQLRFPTVKSLSNSVIIVLIKRYWIFSFMATGGKYLLSLSLSDTHTQIIVLIKRCSINSFMPVHFLPKVTVYQSHDLCSYPDDSCITIRWLIFSPLIERKQKYSFFNVWQLAPIRDRSMSNN